MKFKTPLFILLLSFASGSAIMAQSEENSSDSYIRPTSTFKCNSILSMGFGTGGYYPYTGTSAVENPNVLLSFEKPVIKHAGPGTINLGGLFSYKSIYSSYLTYSSDYSYTQRWRYYILGTRVSYHLAPFVNKNIELYAGAMVAYYITAFSFTSNDPNTSDPTDPGYSLTANHSPNFISPSVFAGVRSWISPHSSVWLELGYGYTALAFGISYKI